MKKLFFLILLSSTTSFGQTFTKISNYPLKNALSTWVFSTSEDNAFITSFNTKALYSTHNGGATWDSTVLGPDVYDFTDVYFTDPMHGWVTGNIVGSLGHGKLFKTTDGGASWNDVSITVNGDSGISKFGAVRFNGPNGIIGANNGIVEADNMPLYYTTTNGGASWTKVHTLPGTRKGDAMEVTRIANNPANGTFQMTGVYATFSNFVLNSLDNGTSFTIGFIEFATPGENIPFDIFSIDRSNTVYWIAAHKLKKSVNGGVSFTDFSYPAAVADAEILSAFFDNETEGYIVGERSSIYKTSDGGVTWAKLYEEVPGRKLRNIFRSGKTIWAVGEEGAIYKATLLAAPTSISEISGKTTRIYPNPANDFIIMEGADEVKVFNMYGQDVTYLVQTSARPGKIKLGLEHLAAGIYLLKTENGLHKIVRN